MSHAQKYQLQTKPTVNDQTQQMVYLDVEDSTEIKKEELGASKVEVIQVELEEERIPNNSQLNPSQSYQKSVKNSVHLSGLQIRERQQSMFKDGSLIELDRLDQSMTSGIQMEKRNEKILECGAGKDEWHKMTHGRLFKELQTTKYGLDSQTHAEKIIKDGLNELTPPKETPGWLIFLKKLVGGFQSLMWFGSVLCFVVYGINSDTQSLGLAIVLILVILLSVMFEFYQEGKSGEVMKALKQLAPTKVNVMRDMKLITVDAYELVVGDIVEVVAGEKVPADVRVLQSADLKVNNASLTGENVDIKLGPTPNAETLYEAKNIARMGCNFTSGKATCVVFATGDNTFFGQIAKSALNIKRPPSQMKLEILRLIKIMAIFASILGIVFFILSQLTGYEVIESIVFMIGIIVANVPEGLLPQITVSFTLTAQKMKTEGVIVQNLDIIETLGAVNVICSDKTGTLTQNRMSVSHLVYNNKCVITENTPNLEGDNFELFDKNVPAFKALQRVATINTDATFLDQNLDINKRKTKGDASETALIKFFDPIRPIEEYRSRCQKHFTVPFNSTNKWMLSIISPEKYSGKLDLLFKGAPEKVLSRCTHILLDGKEVPMTPQLQEDMNDHNEVLAKRGERVLAFAQSSLDSQYNSSFPYDADSDPANFPLDNLTFIGFISLIDPPRKSVKPAIEKCRKAGIQVFMVTGDHPITAHSIAKSLNIITQPTIQDYVGNNIPVPEEGAKAIVIHGTEMLDFTEKDWERVLSHQEIVFARTMPSQKQDIVRELNKRKQIVAMTGDGVNDAPALKAANVGIAMNSGSAVAKEASQLILLNDDFGAVVQGIEEGRNTFSNLKKFISYVLSSNTPELIPFLVFIILKIPLGIETIHILLIDLGTDLAPGISLAYEIPESSIMEQPPRKRDSHIVSPRMMLVSYLNIGLIQTFVGFFAWYWVFYAYGFDFSSLLGSGLSYSDDWKDLNSERRDFFTDMCQENTYYTERHCDSNDVNFDCCHDEFRDYRTHVLTIAQSNYLLHVIWAQIANAFVRKTQIQTIFTKKRMFSNGPLLKSIVGEICLIFILIFVPGLNEALMLHSIRAEWLFVGIWVIPLIIILEEVRKLIIRRSPKGCLARVTAF